MVQIIGKDTVFFNEDKTNWYTFTEVGVIAQFANRSEQRIFKIADSKGYECFSSAGYRNIGDTLLLKGFYQTTHNYGDHTLEYFGDQTLKTVPKEWCLELFLCDYNQLAVRNGRVRGRVDRHFGIGYTKREIFLNKLSFNILRRKTSRRKKRLQNLSTEKVIKRIRRKLNEH